jgi:signal transduction histidine kinase
MRYTTHRRSVMTDWAAAAVGVAGIGASFTQIGDPGLLGMAPILASVLAWSLHRVGARSAAGIVLVAGCVVGAVVGAFTPEAEQSAIAEVMWLTVGSILGAFLLPFRTYVFTAASVIFLESAGSWQNPEIPPRATLYVSGFLVTLNTLAAIALRFVEQQDQHVEAREAALRKALAEARQRAEDLARARMSLSETRGQLVHVGRLASLGEIAAEVSHELNNPLTTVLMSSEVLHDELLARAPELARVAAEVHAAAKACAAVTGRVLWYGRRKGPQMAPVSLSTVVEHALAITRAPLQKGHSTVDVQLDQDAVLVGDTVQLTQVLVNLLINARSVMPDGGTIRVRAGLDAGTAWATVEDDGPGVPRKIADSIFEPFFSTRTEDGGSGLGLAISRAVIETHGGQLTLETVAPEPARFLIRLPDAVAVDAPLDFAATC